MQARASISNLLATANTFEDIKPAKPSPYLPGFNGSAVMSYGTKTGLFSLTLEGIGKNNVVPSINNCKFGVTGFRCGLNIYENRMTNMYTGIYTFFNNYRSLNIKENETNASNFGIYSAANTLAQILKINNNTINLDAGGGAHYSTGIEVVENSSGSGVFVLQIKDNDITVLNGLNAIALKVTGNSLVYNNTISLQDATNTTNGIYANTSTSSRIILNSITGTGPSGNTQKAFNLYRSKLCLLHENYTNETETGLYFDEPCEGTYMICNEIKDHNIGAMVDHYGFFNHFHTLSLNTWTGNIGYRGFDYSNGFKYLDNLFFYNVNDPNTESPNNDPSNFFQTTPDESYGCPVPLDPQISFPVFNDFDFEIAAHAIERPIYQDQYNYMVQSNLFYKASIYPDSIPAESAIDSFYTANQTTTIGLFRAIDRAEETLFKLDSANYKTIYQNDSLITILLNKIAYNDSLVTHVGDEADSLSLLNENQQLKNLIHSIVVSTQGLMTLIDSLNVGYSDSLFHLNDDITTSSVIEENQKQINGIKFNTISKGIFEFDSAQTAVILDVATQCPRSGGKAVIIAQELYRLIYDTVVFNSDTSCYEEEARLAKQEKKNYNNAFVYPNPAANEATLQFSLPEKQNGLFIIYNTLSQEKERFQLQSEQHKFRFTTANLNPGIYYYRIISEYNQVSIGKFTVLR